MNELPGALGVTSTFPFVGRSAELERLRTLLPRADGEERRIVLLGGEAGSGKSRLAREFAAEAAGEGVAGPLRRLPTPWCGRRTGRSSRRSNQLVRALDADELRAALGVGGASWRGCCPTSPRGRPLRRARRRPRHGASPPAHRGRRPAGRRHAAPRRAARARGRRTGPMPPRCCCCGISPARAAPRLLLLATFRDTDAGRARARWPRRWPTCAATTSCGCGCPGSRTTRWPISCAARAAPRPTALAAAHARAHGRQRRSCCASCGAR